MPKHGNPEGSREMGKSFGHILKKNNQKLQRKLDKADKEAEGESNNVEHLEALIRGDNMNKQATMVDSETDEVD